MNYFLVLPNNLLNLQKYGFILLSFSIFAPLNPLL